VVFLVEDMVPGKDEEEWMELAEQADCQEVYDEDDDEVRGRWSNVCICCCI